jgi:hypothetical protein
VGPPDVTTSTITRAATHAMPTAPAIKFSLRSVLCGARVTT